MTGYTADEKLRFEQLTKLRRQWLKDQELSPREPVVAPKTPGRIERFWAGFLQPKTLWRLYTFKAYNASVFAVTRILIPAWIVHYYVKYHVSCVYVCCMSVSLFSILDVFNCQPYIKVGQDHLKGLKVLEPRKCHMELLLLNPDCFLETPLWKQEKLSRIFLKQTVMVIIEDASVYSV
uniref:NADH dehydrogenase [ubiquinone] 1 beta subcomplex subunit 6 n=1 Tax=Cyprinus carpio carpio TaxID=630221 RepID=A0A8C1D0R0_CYPCA